MQEHSLFKTQTYTVKTGLDSSQRAFINVIAHISFSFDPHKSVE